MNSQNILPKIIISLLLCVSLTKAITQELILHESETEDGNYYIFRENVPDTYDFHLNNIKRICFRGGWDLYTEINYFSHAEGSNTPEIRCVNETFPFLSFRHPGSTNTDTDALSLYTGNYEGEELHVDQFPFSGNTMHVTSLGYTGKSDFTLYQGTNYDGPSFCLRADDRGFSWLIPSNNGLTTVGSVVKGCM